MKEKNNFLTHRFLPLLSIFMLCLFILCTSCFAVDITYNDNTYTLPDFPEWINDYKYHLIYTNGACFYLLGSNEKFVYQSPSYIDGSRSFVLISQYPNWSWTDQQLVSFTLKNVDASDIFYADYDIVDDVGNLVFQAAPQKVEQVTIPTIQQAEEIPQAMTEVMKILLPIGLIVLSIGLVIYLTRFVISRIQ